MQHVSALFDPCARSITRLLERISAVLVTKAPEGVRGFLFNKSVASTIADVTALFSTSPPIEAEIFVIADATATCECRIIN
jgi:hypothetical protein